MDLFKQWYSNHSNRKITSQYSASNEKVTSDLGVLQLEVLIISHVQSKLHDTWLTWSSVVPFLSPWRRWDKTSTNPSLGLSANTAEIVTPPARSFYTSIPGKIRLENFWKLFFALVTLLSLLQTISPVTQISLDGIYLSHTKRWKGSIKGSERFCSNADYCSSTLPPQYRASRTFHR